MPRIPSLPSPLTAASRVHLHYIYTIYAYVYVTYLCTVYQLGLTYGKVLSVFNNRKDNRKGEGEARLKGDRE